MYACKGSHLGVLLGRRPLIRGIGGDREGSNPFARTRVLPISHRPPMPKRAAIVHGNERKAVLLFAP
jgi:hypothetical protein